MSGVVDETITGLAFKENKKILFLPVLTSRIYPNLIVFSAMDCSLTSVSKENFQNLRKLKRLQLDQNEIESLNTCSFEDLVQLKELYLGNI